ncbi:hypothetical protein [Paenibacillus tengchongensis]|nr:hypothetical protein [Paenibacillus tengchongensis]
MTETEAYKEWFALSGTVRDLYIVQIDEATGRTVRRIGPAHRKKK